MTARWRLWKRRVTPEGFEWTELPGACFTGTLDLAILSCTHWSGVLGVPVDACEDTSVSADKTLDDLLPQGTPAIVVVKDLHNREMYRYAVVSKDPDGGCFASGTMCLFPARGELPAVRAALEEATNFLGRD